MGFGGSGTLSVTNANFSININMWGVIQNTREL
jgi:hypothetical protein